MTDNPLFKKPNTVNAPIPPAPIIPAAEPVEETAELPKVDELTMLKQRATMMGVKFSNNIGLEALRAKVNAAVEGEAPAAEDDEDEAESQDAPQAAPTKPEKPESIRQRMQAEQLKLVRVRVTCLDPKKKDLPGEIFTTGNKYIGTVRKFVPFGEMTDNGYHIPYIIYNMMKEREFVQIKTRKTPRGEIVETNTVREFALEVLPPLTEAELADMKAAQLSRGDHA